MLNIERNSKVISRSNGCTSDTVRSCMLLSALVMTRSKILPLICVGQLTSWVRLYSYTRSHKELEREVPDRVDQQMSGRLKSTTMIRVFIDDAIALVEPYTNTV